jgi:hypothetical protein
MKITARPVSLGAVIIFSLFALGLMLTAADYMVDTKIIGWDVSCYYNYLPAVFKYHSLDFAHMPLLRPAVVVTPEGFVVEKTTMGLSFLYLPFYLLAWLYIIISGLPDQEYSTPYSIALALSAIFYFTLGMIFLRKVLLKYFNDIVTAIGLAVIFLGTNMVFYTVYEGPMSHAYVFFLISVFLWLVIKWHEQPSWKTTAWLGLVSGLLTLVRPSTITIVLFAALYSVYDRQSVKIKLQLLIKNWGKILLIAALAILIWLPQMLYWKQATGHYLFFSYSGERFFWDAPMIHYGFFSFRNGWLMYSPVMIFSLIGMFFMRDKLKTMRLGIIIYFLISIYIIFSWWCWWWVGLGIRAMIELYPILAIALCAFLDWMLKRRRIFQIIISVFIAFFFLFGLFKNWQFKRSMIHYDGMTGKAYWSILFKTELPKGYWDMLKCPDYDEARKGNR